VVENAGTMIQIAIFRDAIDKEWNKEYYNINIHIGLLGNGGVAMKLSTKGRYGLRAMVDLAVHSTVGVVSIKSIAERQQISENYLEQVFSSLRKAGLVKSIKGAQGGYVLASEPSKITVGDILTVMEGSLEVVETGESSQTGDNPIEDVIVTHVWEKINSCIREYADSITLQDLVDEYKRINSGQGYMFYI